MTKTNEQQHKQQKENAESKLDWNRYKTCVLQHILSKSKQTRKWKEIHVNHIPASDVTSRAHKVSNLTISDSKLRVTKFNNGVKFLPCFLQIDRSNRRVLRNQLSLGKCKWNHSVIRHHTH